MEHLSYEEGLRNLVLFSLEEMELWGDLIVAFQYLKGAYEEHGERFFTRTWSELTACRGKMVYKILGRNVSL